MTTVKEAIEAMIRERNVETGRVSGLSRQIIAQMNTLQTGILVNFESLPGINSSGEAHLNLYLQAGAREALRAALRSGIAQQPSLRMTINSAFRTVAQQHILYRVYQRDPKLIPLAAKPGNSNHEDGLAIDVNNYNAWKTYLLANGWQWLGGNDPVHFFNTNGRDDISTLGVKAFQSLWNRYNPTDRMTVDGNFGDQTAAKMDRCPIRGFSVVSVFRLGDNGAVVTRIQQHLTNVGFSVPINGVFDDKTKAAVIKFQLKQGLAADGDVGPMTLKLLGIRL
ncbi:peptidoglycan-binding protein [Chamaesiphon minutus]|uniref:D-alanyl-D-alanine carboxypeptidase n=1 Tax=Chamaesiphon minutus (strain ATCC 27169 / PCC 6605) TaxID=1173020 RepID=K9UNZ4_CHAP6|nr:peptidoglycan-binding protein [Chamaesiphon minutus]AFY96161.1 D-alanyl-D-alanine carboxypeptidase [Chamaesiphon minutus PCC 6605]